MLVFPLRSVHELVECEATAADSHESFAVIVVRASRRPSFLSSPTVSL